MNVWNGLENSLANRMYYLKLSVYCIIAFTTMLQQPRTYVIAYSAFTLVAGHSMARLLFVA